TAVVHDHLAVAQAGSVLVLLHAVSNGEHDERGLLLGERSHRAVVVRGEDEDLVDATRRCLGEHRTPVLDHEGVVALEGWIAVGHYPHEPPAGGSVGLEGGKHGALVARTEGTRDALEGVEGGLPGDEQGLPLTAVSSHRDPPPRKGIKTQLVHARVRTSPGAEVLRSIVINLHAIATNTTPHGHPR